MLKKILKCTAIFILFGLFLGINAFAGSKSLTGAGSSFLYPAMSIWTKAYYDKTGEKINYQAIGSGAGISMLLSGTVNFSATEIPVLSDQITKNNWMVFPVASSGIVPVINVPGIKNNELVLSGPVLADIYLGKIKYWNDSKIINLNPKIKLPHKKIVLIHRIGMSGTTYIFTKYLSDISVIWEQSVGANSMVQWPCSSVGGRENAGEAAYLEQIPYSIGYIEYSYIQKNNLTCVKMLNKNGKVVTANLKSFKTALKNYSWSNDQPDVNAIGDGSWPIVATTYILYKKDVSSKGVNKFFNFILNSDTLKNKAHDLGYIVVHKIYKINN
ncbi:MAG: phosphate ABC transporter substrate-binding protein PstS [bacterium]|nr:phosphate ABC transporter substrate-binding protein PstS [bacterium]